MSRKNTEAAAALTLIARVIAGMEWDRDRLRKSGDEEGANLRSISINELRLFHGSLRELIEAATPCAIAYTAGVPTRKEIERLHASLAVMGVRLPAL